MADTEAPQLSSGGFEAAFTESLADTASPAVHPETSAEPTAAPPVVAPTDGTGPDPDRSSFIPRARFDEVNTRMQRAEARATELAWAERVTPQQFQEMERWWTQAARDPVGLYQTLTQELNAHPEYGPRIRSEAAKVLASMRGVATEEPQADLQTPDGELVYSAKQLKAWQGWNQRQTETQWDSRLKPLEQQQQEVAAERQLTALTSRANHEASEVFQEMQGWHDFEKYRPSIAKAYLEHPQWTPERAYLHVLHTEILPTLSTTEQAKVMADLTTKAVAQTVNPGRPVTAGTKPLSGSMETRFAQALGVTKE